jgi:small-conductance mechanosensitive channel
MIKVLVVILPAILSAHVPALAGEAPGNMRNPPPTAGTAVTAVPLWSSQEFILSCAILLFGIIIIALQYSLMRINRQAPAADIFRYYTITLIIIGALVLVSAGLSDRQISPVIGLFGTIAGYVLGRSESNRARINEKEDGPTR